MRRVATWLVVVPFAAASMLGGHAAAYAIAGAPQDSFHGYLDHAPQVVAVLALLALLGLARDVRASSQSVVPIASLAAVGFACQEHLERLGHTGELPALLGSSTFWLGLAFQLPLAAAVWLAARAVARSLAEAPRRRHPPRLGALLAEPVAPLTLAPAGVPAGAVPGRGPPRRS